MKIYPVNKRVKKGVCTTTRCGKPTTGKFCSTCRSRQTRLKDPVRYSYLCKRNRAKQRGIHWDLTLEEFREFCYETQYMAKKGRTVGSYDVDRIVEGKFPGYTKSNIQILEKRKNILKYCAYDAEKRQLRACSMPEIPYVPEEDLPF